MAVNDCGSGGAPNAGEPGVQSRSRLMDRYVAGMQWVSSTVSAAKQMNFARGFCFGCQTRTVCSVAADRKILAIAFYTSCHNPSALNTVILCLRNFIFEPFRAPLVSRMSLLTISSCLFLQPHAKTIKHLRQQMLNKTEAETFTRK